MKLKECCEKYVYNCQPQEGGGEEFFVEHHQCSVCHETLIVTFEEVQTFEETNYVPIKASYNLRKSN